MKRLYEVCTRGSVYPDTGHPAPRGMFVVYAENNGSIQGYFDTWLEHAIEEIAVSSAFYRDGYDFGSLSLNAAPLLVLFGRNPVFGDAATYVDAKIDNQKGLLPKRILELQ